MSEEMSLPLFWALAALLVAIAAVIVIRPLLRRAPPSATSDRRSVNIAVYRDQLQEMERDLENGLIGAEQFQAGRREIEARLAEDALQGDEAVMQSRSSRRLGYSLGTLLPAAAIGLYLLLGQPDAIVQDAVAQVGPEGRHDIASLLSNLEAKVKADPKDPAKQLMLARTYAALERWPDALRTYETVTRLAPDQAAAWSGYAEALAIVNNRALDGKPMEMVRKALELDNNDAKALELAGIHAYQAQNFTQAAYYWRQLLKQLPPDSPYAQDIAAAMREAKGRAEAAFGAPLDKILPDDPRLAASTIQGRVEVAAPLKSQLPADATVFVFARAVAGNGPPLAAIRAKAGDLPLEFVLDDTMSMDPQRRLSTQTEVSLTARVSKSGQPGASKGDLEGSLSPVKLGSRDVRLVIDKVHD